MDENMNENLNEDMYAGAGAPEEGQKTVSGGEETTGQEGFQYSDSGNRFYQDDAYYHTEGSSYTGSGEEPRVSASAQTGGSYRSDDSRYYQAGEGSSSYRSSASYTGASPSGPSPSDGGRRGGRGRAVLAVILALVIGAGAGAGAMSVSGLMSRIGSRQARVETQEETQEGTQEEAQDSSGEKKDQYSLTVSQSDSVVTGVTEVAANVMPSIVSVYNNYTSAVEFFGQTYSQEGVSTGSGIIVAETDTELLIVTNNHVVKNADSLSVQFINEDTAEAAIKGTDASNDLAVIAVKTEDLSQETRDAIAIATLGDSEALKIGEPAIAIGNALGYGQSVTVGYISALNRQIEMDDNYTNTFIQTDAAINPGNSGGALVNIKGEVVGINSNKIGGDKVEGMGFAIPVSRALPIIENLMNQTTKYTVAEEKQGTLGISGRDVTSDIASAYGMPQGVYIAKFVEGGAAENTDLHVGDIITAIGGSSVSSMMELKKQLTYYEAGSKVTVTVSRQNEKGEYESMDIDVTLGTRASLESGSGQENRNPFGGRNN
ncbi:MAG: trypsin-like peptidase domain-containing protein [Lachnospiraceae bacterium]|nr:trypsin-like peptidase domain-containing protein [Lachnospiraceae bacterium]